jgi:hypothetical protein
MPQISPHPSRTVQKNKWESDTRDNSAKGKNDFGWSTQFRCGVFSNGEDRDCTVMAVKRIIRLGPENRIVISIEAVRTHDYFAVSKWWFGNEGLIRSGDEIFSVEEESPDFAIRRTNVPCKDAFSSQTIANSRFNIPPFTRNLSKSSFVSTAVILISSC